MARRSDPESLIKAVFALICLCALGIGGLAHFAQALWALIIGIAVLCLAGGALFAAWRIRLRTEVRWAMTLGIVGLLLLGLLKMAQPPPEWLAEDVRVTSVKTPPATIQLSCSVVLGKQQYAATALRTYPSVEAAATALPGLRNRKTVIFVNPANPAEIDTAYRSGWKGSNGTIVDATLLPPPEVPTEVRGLIGNALFPAQVQVKLPPGAEAPKVGETLRVYVNPEKLSEMSLAPHATAEGIRNVPLLTGAVVTWLGAVIFIILAWVRRNELLSEPPVVASTTSVVSGTPPKDDIAPSRAGPPTAMLREIDWYQFEKLVGRLLTHEGYEVKHCGGAKADGGVDLVAEKGGEKIIVQCKHWQSWRVKEGTIREMIGTLKLHGGNRLSLYTLNASTSPAGRLARGQGIEIITEGEILDRMRAIGMDRFADLLDPANKHCPICDGPLVLRTGGFKPFWGCTRYPKCRGKIEAS